MLLSLKHLVDGFTMQLAWFVTIMQIIFVNGGISNFGFISKKLMFFGFDGVSIFQGCCTSVIV
jgi:hypothetical protein